MGGHPVGGRWFLHSVSAALLVRSGVLEGYSLVLLESSHGEAGGAGVGGTLPGAFSG